MKHNSLEFIPSVAGVLLNKYETSGKIVIFNYD